MSKNVFSQLFHSPFAQLSNLAMSAVLTFKIVFIDWKSRSVGSIWTESLTELRLIDV